MKILGLILLSFAFLFTLALAGETGGADYTSPNGTMEGYADWLNSQNSLDHSHKYIDSKYDPEHELGAGVDVVVYEAEAGRKGIKKAMPDEVSIQNKYDFSNQNGSTYVVAKYNLWKVLKKK